MDLRKPLEEIEMQREIDRTYVKIKKNMNA
jgi:hypothetical protein